MDNRWVTLLNYWQETLSRHAITFPFLVGALRIPVASKFCSAGNDKKELEILIDVMRSQECDGYIYHIYRCPDIAQLVITKVKGAYPPPTAIAIANPDSSIKPSLYASDGIELNATSPLESLTASILEETSQAIENCQFSCRGKTFKAFNDYELGVINKALA